jgi:hypothetical protein
VSVFLIFWVKSQNVVMNQNSFSPITLFSLYNSKNPNTNKEIDNKIPKKLLFLEELIIIHTLKYSLYNDTVDIYIFAASGRFPQASRKPLPSLRSSKGLVLSSLLFPLKSPLCK